MIVFLLFFYEVCFWVIGKGHDIVMIKVCFILATAGMSHYFFFTYSLYHTSISSKGYHAIQLLPGQTMLGISWSRPPRSMQHVIPVYRPVGHWHRIGVGWENALLA